MIVRHELVEALSQLGQQEPQEEITRVSGGCINSCYALRSGSTRLFVKINDAARMQMFQAEHDGLDALARAGAVRVPHPLGCTVAGEHAFLVLEHLELGGQANPVAAGQRLALLHRASGPHFGWASNNFIGSTPQRNTPAHDWAQFWRERRLGAQLVLARGNGFGRVLDRGEQLVQRLPALFAGYAPACSLLHGDLWAGNLDYMRDGEPVVFDPAVYYGDRETDLAMTELFGGFGADFHAAYHDAWPLEQGYPVRRQLYNLYHVLNHLNLFGSAYLGQACTMIDQLLAELN